MGEAREKTMDQTDTYKNCSADLKPLQLTRLTVEYAGVEFCCELCLDEWIDQAYKKFFTHIPLQKEIE